MERMEAKMDEITFESASKDERINMLFSQNMDLHHRLERSMQSFRSDKTNVGDKNGVQSATSVNGIPTHRGDKERERDKPLTERVKISQTTNNPFQ